MKATLQRKSKAPEKLDMSKMMEMSSEKTSTTPLDTLKEKYVLIVAAE